MSAKTTIALDAMSGDLGPGVVVEAALSALEQHPDLKLILVGDRETLEGLLDGHKRIDSLRERLEIQHTTEVVTMDDAPALALRNKKDSSMRVCINLVKEGRSQACVSAGNTGALMATARFVLKMIAGIERPAICTALPSRQGHTFVMDLGANVNCSSEHLYQFATMGAVLVNAVDGQARPRIGLLNVGEEENKGNDVVKQAHELLNAGSLNYIGYVEGNDIFGDKADVIVTDGFVGNVALKTIEGVANYIRENLVNEFKRGPLSRLAGLIALPVLRRFKRKVDPRRYNGASLLGLQGIVVKSHGGADRVAFANAINIAMLEVRHNVIEAIDSQININGGPPA